MGIHVVTVMLLYVTLKNITELEMVESKFKSEPDNVKSKCVYKRISEESEMDMAADPNPMD